ncbi:NAD-binding protein [Thermodesulfobacteriota bacterium]
MEHDLSHFPTSLPLMFIYFFAPVIAISALGTAITYFFRFTPAVATRLKSDHVLICGVGRTGKLLAETLKKNDVAVVGVDIGSPENYEDWRTEHKVPMIFGDFNSRTVLERAGAAKARSIIFASGDDLANLEGVVAAYGWLQDEPGPIRLFWAHIANERLANTARFIFETDSCLGIRYFDTYYIAAKNMVEKFFEEDIRSKINQINILGFGKFGRDLLEVLVHVAGTNADWSIQVVDIRDIESHVQSVAKELNVADRITFINRSIQDLKLSGGKDKAFFLCTDDDIGNLTVSMILVKNLNCDHIYVRMAAWPMPAIADHLGENSGITFFNINELVVQGIKDLPGIFKPAKLIDIKRSKRASACDY